MSDTDSRDIVSRSELADAHRPIAGDPYTMLDGTGALSADDIDRAIEAMRVDQRLNHGVIAAAVASSVGAAGWAALTVATGYQLGYVALGIGALVGLAMRWFGRGVDQRFGVVAGILAVLGCIAGNMLAIVAIVADELGIAYGEALSLLSLGDVLTLMAETTRPVTLIIYAASVYGAYKFAFRRMTPADIEAYAAGMPKARVVTTG